MTKSGNRKCALFIMPHPDDEAISCSGAITSHRLAGDFVVVGFVYGRVFDYGRKPSSSKMLAMNIEGAKNVLGYDDCHMANLIEGEPGTSGFYKALEFVEGLLDTYNPYAVYIPGQHDLNQDHRHLYDVCRIALRPGNLKTVDEIHSFVGADHIKAEPNMFVPLTAIDISIKVAALNCYASEIRHGYHPRSERTLKAAATFWGSKAGVEYAEAYTTIMRRMTCGL